MQDGDRPPRTIENPFIKPENREWSISLPASVNAPVSPPRSKRRRLNTSTGVSSEAKKAAQDSSADPEIPPSPSLQGPSVTDIEAGKVEIENHLEYISAVLAKVCRPTEPGVPRLHLNEWVDLYKRSQHSQGRHFVVHQHDHPVAGPHYDLRLQISESSSISFAIMYGLPGNPNSRKLNRNATETRVHTLWSHLTEAGSASTGSLIIWDTGEYSILPYYENKSTETENSNSDTDQSQQGEQSVSESEKLRMAFQQRKIRLRLHGTRLPPDYTVSLRLSSANDESAQPRPPARKRRRKQSTRAPSPGTSDEDLLLRTGTGTSAPSTPTTTPGPDTPGDIGGGHSDAEEDKEIRRTNAYPGAVNDVSSVHQRRWFLSLDRENSGFQKEYYRDGGTKRHRWVRRKVLENGRDRLLGFEPFYVRGPEVERSVVTGRLGADVLQDEGVIGFIGRKGWKPVLI